ncbi:TPM domain-containing protein [Paenibacillus sp. CMAA1364]
MNRMVLAILIILGISLAIPVPTTMAAPEIKTLIFDEAGLLTKEESDELNLLANELGAERETDIIIYTSNNDDNIDVMKMTQDFYDEQAPGYDKRHGNAVILTMDMRNRDIYLAGFYKGKEYLDDRRLDKIRDKITPSLTSGDYDLAFHTYTQTAHKYMGYSPGVNPDNILFKLWFQLAVSLGLGGIVVGLMAYRSGGQVTVNRQTYEDASTSGILDHRDQYLRTTTTRRKIEKNNGSGSGGGGGTTGGGHSHSGSRGSF